MKNNIIIGALVLSLGLNVYQVVENGRHERDYYRQGEASGFHRMPDGSMMGNMSGSGNAMADMMQNMNAGLQNKTGDAFDKEFLSEMIIHHQGAVDMAKQVLSTSKRPELLKLANDIINAQTTEIGMMKGWQTSWYK